MMSKDLWNKDPFEEFDHLFSEKSKDKGDTITVKYKNGTLDIELVRDGSYLRIDNTYEYEVPKIPSNIDLGYDDKIVPEDMPSIIDGGNMMMFRGTITRDQAYKATGLTYEEGDWVINENTGDYWVVTR